MDLATDSKPLQARTGQVPRAGTIHPVFAFFACAAVLLPAHPSLQSVFLAYGIPAPFVSAAFSVSLLYFPVTRRILTRRNLGALLLFLVYISWLLARATLSPALGLPNFIASVRGTTALVPLALLCAAIASQNPQFATRTIFVFSLASITHFCVIAISGGTLSTPSELLSLSADPESQNYQSTSFYFGLAAVAMASIAFRARGPWAIFATLGALFITALMGVVGGRAALIALIASAMWIAATLSFRSLIRKAIFASLALTFVLFGAFLSDLLDFEEILNRIIVIDRLLALTEEGDSSQRIRLFGAALSMWLDSPRNFLFGGGIGAFPNFIGESNEGWYPHNFILESLAEGGLIAGVLILLIGLHLTREFAKLHSTHTAVEDVILGALAFYATIAYQFIGGLQTLWMPTFFVALFLFRSSQSKT